MDQAGTMHLLLRCALAVLVGLALWLPAWWAAGRLNSAATSPFFRLLMAVGGVLVAWLGVLNLLGRQLENSLAAAWIWLGVNLAADVWLLWRRRDRLCAPRSGRHLAELGALDHAGPRRRLSPVDDGRQHAVLGRGHVERHQSHRRRPVRRGRVPAAPQCFPGPSAEVPLRRDHVGGLGDLADRALGQRQRRRREYRAPPVRLSVRLLLAPTIGFRRLACLWGSFTVLLGGGLAWLYVPWLHTYDGFPKHGIPSLLRHHYDAGRGWWNNLLDAAGIAAFHLQNADGSNSNLPWDVVNQFQQHAVALGLALTLLSGWLFCTWIGRDRFSPRLLAASTVTFGLLFLGHAVFAAVACVTAGLVLAGRWLYCPSLARFLESVAFTAGVTALAFAHGGVLSRSARYGADITTLTLRDGFGYSEGGLLGFVNWNLAGFGLPLLLALWALGAWVRHHRVAAQPQRHVFAFFAVMLLASYLPPQVLYYSYGGLSIEEYTEVAKFFFVTTLPSGCYRHSPSRSRLAASPGGWCRPPSPRWQSSRCSTSTRPRSLPDTSGRGSTSRHSPCPGSRTRSRWASPSDA